VGGGIKKSGKKWRVLHLHYLNHGRGVSELHFVSHLLEFTVHTSTLSRLIS
jgi:hypothetical protein